MFYLIQFDEPSRRNVLVMCAYVACSVGDYCGRCALVLQVVLPIPEAPRQYQKKDLLKLKGYGQLIWISFTSIYGPVIGRGKVGQPL